VENNTNRMGVAVSVGFVAILKMITALFFSLVFDGLVRTDFDVRL
jgi:hypothetical protein